jgi:tetratricopeptide (TPR) repeat protein
MKGGIEAVLIAKNEEKNLSRCLGSLRELDGIVVYDTGSSDRTADVALSFGARVFRREPIVPFHFAEARNRALSFAREDWALSIDADEALRPGSVSALRKAILYHGAAEGFQVSFVMLEEDGGERDPIFKHLVFRKDLWTWRWRVHERLYPKEGAGGRLANVPGAVWEHLPLVGKEARRDQNLELLKLSVEEDPENVQNSRQLALELFLRGRPDEAIPYMARFAVGGDPADRTEKSEALAYLGRFHAAAGRLDEALPWFEKAAETAPWRREPPWYAAVELIRAARLEEAKGYIERVLAIPEHQKPGSRFDLEIWDSKMPREALEFCTRSIEEAKAKWEAMKKEKEAP